MCANESATVVVKQDAPEALAQDVLRSLETPQTTPLRDEVLDQDHKIGKQVVAVYQLALNRRGGASWLTA